MKRAIALALLGAVAGCGLDSSSDANQETEIPDVVKATKVEVPAVESEYGTPVKDRVVTLGVLNKRNNLTQDLVLKSGESQRIGNLVVRAATCERSLPWESPPETGAFVQVFVEERPRPSEPRAWQKVFSGWLFQNSPSLNVVEHPVYDVWVKDCAMKFPGEEAIPADEESSRSAAKPTGRATATPAATPSPSPTATATSTPAPTATAPATASPSPAE